MTGARASATLRAGSRTGPWASAGTWLLSVAVATCVLALALVSLLSPLYMHPALDAAGAPASLGLSSAETQALSDMTVGELLFGPGTFAFAGPDGSPFLGADEAGHMRDVRLVLYAFLGLALVSAIAVAVTVARRGADPAVWRAIARGGAGLMVAVAVLGVFAALAFNAAFELFHRLLFPGGNWSFDPGSQRLVQLYPLPFWQITAGAMGVLAVVGGLVAWAAARYRARALEAAA